MKIVLPYAKLLRPERLAGALTQIEYASRISHRSEEDSGKTTDRFISAVVVGHGDWSVVEHVSTSVEFLVDRGITHEIVRHRLFSYTQESTRFVNYAKKMPPSFIYPKQDRYCEYCREGLKILELSGNFVHDEGGGLDYVPCSYENAWLTGIQASELAYTHLLSIGWRPQEARSVFPNALASKLVMTGNLRAWRHFFVMRTSAEAHPQMRQVVDPLLKQFQDAVPLLYADIIPGTKQSIAMQLVR